MTLFDQITEPAPTWGGPWSAAAVTTWTRPAIRQSSSVSNAVIVGSPDIKTGRFGSYSHRPRGRPVVSGHSMYRRRSTSFSGRYTGTSPVYARRVKPRSAIYRRIDPDKLGKRFITVGVWRWSKWRSRLVVSGDDPRCSRISGSAETAGLGECPRPSPPWPRPPAGPDHPYLDHPFQRVVFDIDREVRSATASSRFPIGEDQFR